jgi:16S rRNA (cytidine1402-2'-O)-methyltransferase
VALVTDAGMPGISDPGYQVVKLVVEKGFKVVPIPGASALVAALPASGLIPTPFLFAGFLPPKSGDRRQALLKLKPQEQTLVFYEAPHRLVDFLKDALEVFGQRQAVAARELTKLHEEFVRGTLEELLNHFKIHEPLGELVVMVEAAAPGSNDKPPEWEGISVADHLIQLMKEEGFTKTEAVKAVAKARRLPRDEVYQIAVTVNYSGKD